VSVVSIHPEELLDKLSAGELTAAERELLEAHLAGCDVCRFELAVSMDLQSEAREQERSHPSVRLLLGSAAPTTQTRAAAPPPAPVVKSERPRSRRLILALAAALVIASTGAVAAVTRPGQFVVALLRVSEPAPAPASPSSRAAAPAPVARAPLQAQPTEPAVASAAVPVSSAPVRSPRSIGSQPLAPPAASALEGSAGTLFASANQARRRGDLAQASALYRELQKTFPSSQEAELSQITLSMLLLDRGDAAGALAGFDRYLARSRRPLEAEALVGRARALGALGSRAAEAGAWREVQRKYPGSVYARQAGDRLEALGQP
jgi:TolA-binding protein